MLTETGNSNKHEILIRRRSKKLSKFFRPSTSYPRPSTIYPRPSTIYPRPSTSYPRPSTLDEKANSGLTPCKCSASDNSPTRDNSILAPKSKVWQQKRHNQRIMTQKASSSFTICHIFALEINYFPVLLFVRVLLTRSTKRNKRKVVSGSRVTLPVNFACKPRLSYNPLARVTLAVGLPYLLVTGPKSNETVFSARPDRSRSIPVSAYFLSRITLE